MRISLNIKQKLIKESYNYVTFMPLHTKYAAVLSCRRFYLSTLIAMTYRIWDKMRLSFFEKRSLPQVSGNRTHFAPYMINLVIFPPIYTGLIGSFHSPINRSASNSTTYAPKYSPIFSRIFNQICQIGQIGQIGVI